MGLSCAVNGPTSEWRVGGYIVDLITTNSTWQMQDTVVARGQPLPGTRQSMPEHRQSAFDSLMARHETINRRFKEFAILGSQYRHEEEKHGEIFHCVAVLVQLDIAFGGLKFPVPNID
jgi:hypothetical protein